MKNSVSLKKMIHWGDGGGGSKMCHVLFEWPLTNKLLKCSLLRTNFCVKNDCCIKLNSSAAFNRQIKVKETSPFLGGNKKRKNERKKERFTEKQIQFQLKKNLNLYVVEKLN